MERQVVSLPMLWASSACVIPKAMRRWRMVRASGQTVVEMKDTIIRELLCVMTQRGSASNNRAEATGDGQRGHEPGSQVPEQVGCQTDRSRGQWATPTIQHDVTRPGQH